MINRQGNRKAGVVKMVIEMNEQQPTGKCSIHVHSSVMKGIKFLMRHIKRLKNSNIEDVSYPYATDLEADSYFDPETDLDAPDLTDRINKVAFAVDYELLENAMFAKIGYAHKNIPQIRAHLQKMANIYGAWLAYLSNNNNLVGEMRGDIIAYESPIVTELLEKAPQPDPESLNRYYKDIWQYIHQVEVIDLPYPE